MHMKKIDYNFYKITRLNLNVLFNRPKKNDILGQLPSFATINIHIPRYQRFDDKNHW